jgi:hypothetical protein
MNEIDFGWLCGILEGDRRRKRIWQCLNQFTPPKLSALEIIRKATL